MAERRGNKTRMTLYLTDEQMDYLKEFCDRYSVSRNSAIGMIIKSFMAQDRLLSGKSDDQLLETLDALKVLLKESKGGVST